MKLEKILQGIEAELEEAEEKHPNWPTDIIHAAAIVAEESGELIRASLNYKYEEGNLEELRLEAIQTAAMAIRFLKNLD